MLYGINLRDLLYKAFWTGVAGVLATLAVLIPDLPPELIPLVTVLFNMASAYVRQRTGETPPTLGPPPA